MPRTFLPPFARSQRRRSITPARGAGMRRISYYTLIQPVGVQGIHLGAFDLATGKLGKQPCQYHGALCSWPLPWQRALSPMANPMCWRTRARVPAVGTPHPRPAVCCPAQRWA